MVAILCLLSCPKIMLIKARSVNKMTHLIHDLIVGEDVDLTCITEPWLGSGGDVTLSLLCPPGSGIWHHLQAEGRGGGGRVALVIES